MNKLFTKVVISVTFFHLLAKKMSFYNTFYVINFWLNHKIGLLPSSAPVGNFSWNWAELALLSVFPPAGRWPEKYPNCLIQINWPSNMCMEDDLTFFVVNGRRPHIFVNGRRPPIFCKWKTTSHFLVNGRRHQFFGKWKTTSNILQMEDDLKFACTWKTNGRRPQLFCKWKINGKQPEFILKNLKTTESFQNARKQS